MALVPHSNDPQHKEYIKNKEKFVHERENGPVKNIRPVEKTTEKTAGK